MAGMAVVMATTTEEDGAGDVVVATKAVAEDETFVAVATAEAVATEDNRAVKWQRKWRRRGY